MPVPQFSVTDPKTGNLTNSLRGFPLDGRVTSLPTGYTGLVSITNQNIALQCGFRVLQVVEGPRAGLAGAARDLRVTSSFREMTYWNYDRVPGPGDALQQAWQWVDLAAALHTD